MFSLKLNKQKYKRMPSFKHIQVQVDNTHSATASTIHFGILTTLLRHCATSRKVAGSIPNDVTGILIDIILLAALWPWG